MKKVLIAITTLLLASSRVVFAENSPGVANTKTCNKFINTDQPFILVLDSGDDLLKSITRCAADAQLKAASINGLGQVHNPTLAYFSSNPNDKPMLTNFSGYYELAAFNGNVTNNDNKYYTHAHAVIADKKFHGIAGHVDHAKVGLTTEITITPILSSVQRTVDEKTGFGQIVH